MEESSSKISLPEILIVGPIFFLIPDLIEAGLLLIGLDDFFLSDLYSLLSSQIYLRIKGVKTTYTLVTNCLELIPYFGALPLKTIGFLITAYLENKKHRAIENII